MTASVPTFNEAGHYVRRLVEKGHRVGIVRQTETSAEKQASSSSSIKTFQRALTATYSSTTMIGHEVSMNLMCVTRKSTRVDVYEFALGTHKVQAGKFVELLF